MSTEIMSIISVVIPSYNHEKFLDEAIRSVFLQLSHKYKIELIVVDDSSTDASIIVLNTLQKGFDFQVIVNQTNLGLNQTLEIGIECATGEYICFLASDDYFLEGKFHRQLSLLKSNGSDCVYSAGVTVDSLGSVVAQQNLIEFETKLLQSSLAAYKLLAVDDTCGPLLQSAMFKTSVAKKINKLRRKFKSDDWVILLELLKSYKVSILNEVLFAYRVHNDNTHSKYWDILPMRLEVPCKYLSDDEMWLREKSISNLFLSQSAALYRDKKYLVAIRFFIASLCFGLPKEKFYRVFKRRLSND